MDTQPSNPQPDTLDTLTIRTALENAISHLDGTAQWFSARNKGAVLWQLRQALATLDELERAAASPRA